MEISLLLQMKTFPARRTISCMATKSSTATAPPPFQLMNEKTNNLYEILSLDSTKKVGLDEIKKAYRCKALEFHPDTCPAAKKEESTRRFMEINMAYETLSDPVSREIYDYELGLLRLSCGDSRRSRGTVTREVWQRQLDGLKKRSMSRRMKENIST